ncbi:PAS domain S-box-containing protein [Rhizobiales bacterium GAS113]|nr:PAS domain S-box-containing protein [Rhizobiales bacterium GAS113]
MLQTLRGQARHQQPTATDPTSRWVGSIGLAVAVGISYFLAARLSLALLTKPDGVAVFWPAAGVSAGALIALGPGARLPVAVGAMVATIVANLLGDRTLLAAIIFALCNAGEALLTASLIERQFGSGFGLDRLRHVLGFLAAAIVATAVSGIGGTVGFKYFHGSTGPILTTWQHWFASDALGIVTVAPLLIGLASAARELPPRNEIIEGVMALVMLSVMSGLVIVLPREPWATVAPIALLFPLLLWLAARCRPAFAAAAAFIVALTIVWTTTFGIGYFGDPALSMADRVLGAQAGILATSLCAFVLAALFAERRQNEAALMEGEARLQEALTAGAVTAFEWDPRIGSSRRSGNAAQILGFDPQQPFTGTQFLARVHPDDRARFKALVHGVRPDSPSYTVTFRFIRLDGREVWLEETSRAEFDAAGHYIRFKGLTLDITERKRAQEHQDRLVAELDHRVKNVLARVAAVAMFTHEGSSSMDDFVQALNRRIQSMADAHALLSQSRWRGVRLTDLVHSQLAPYATNANMTIAGPDITLTAGATEAVAMVLQELVTNAVKHGALSTPDGRVSLSWDRPDGDAAAHLAMVWRELSGPPIVAPIQSGYGTNLIRDLIPHELGGKVGLVFASRGVCCRIEIPLERG